MNDDKELIIAKLNDKINISKRRNKIVNTEFLTIYDRDIIQKELNRRNFKNYFFFGAYNEAEGKVLVVYPEKLGEEFVRDNLKTIVKVIKISLPKELKGKYSHRQYLGAVMRSGLNRDRIRRYYCV